MIAYREWLSALKRSGRFWLIPPNAMWGVAAALFAAILAHARLWSPWRLSGMNALRLERVSMVVWSFAAGALALVAGSARSDGGSLLSLDLLIWSESSFVHK